MLKIQCQISRENNFKGYRYQSIEQPSLTRTKKKTCATKNYIQGFFEIVNRRKRSGRFDLIYHQRFAGTVLRIARCRTKKVSNKNYIQNKKRSVFTPTKNHIILNG
mmetsp:Transcript_37321/g.43445  ORF Transcript_37321/g.43445 Transcript_37321/m.43445 type:complete len:106 (+) Transcript_37321:303-620(+)